MELSLTQVAIDLISKLGYGGLLLGLFLDSFGPPIPSEILIPLATVLVVQGRFEAWLVFVVATVGQILGATAAYMIGRYAGEPFLERYGKYLFITRKEINRAHQVFERYGHWMVLVGRCVPGIRGIIGYPAGVSEMKLGLYLIFTALGSAAWTALMMYLGYVVGANIKQLDVIAHQFTLAGAVVLVLFLIWYFRKVWRPWFGGNR